MSLSKYRKQIIVLLDIFIQCGSALLMYLMIAWQYPTRMEGIDLSGAAHNVALMVVCVLIFQLLLRTYDSLWRYAESWEYFVLLMGQGLGFLLYLAVSFLIAGVSLPVFFMIGVAATSLMGMLLMRFIYRLYRRRAMAEQRDGKIHVAIVGAGEGGVALMSEMKRNTKKGYEPYCFFDDDREKIGKLIHGIPVRGPINSMVTQIKNSPVSEIILAIPTMTQERRKEIITMCTGLKCQVKIMPSPLGAVKELDLNTSIRPVSIDDLLGRAAVELDSAPVREMLFGKTVLVTGGGGSIGSELCRQIVKQRPAKLVVLDIYENNAYDLQQELRMEYGDRLDLCIEIASVRDFGRLCAVMRKYGPDYVFHAAAHKHVPLMEDCPGEAIKNNVFGTYNAARAAALFDVKKFVLISTDKAVNPTNVMGASKRLCEMVVQSLNQPGGTEYCAVRFGNVLGSNGSVVPLFQRQIAQGGPVTLTDKRVIRYFMSIPEAAQLVLQAGAMAHKGEVFVLDMGAPVKVLDLAENLIRLSGHRPYQDIAIEEVGLRPGEKLYEELLLKGDELETTANDKIYVERQPTIAPDRIERDLSELRVVLSRDNREELLEQLHRIVPSFREPEEVNQKAAERLRLLEAEREEKVAACV